MGATQGSPIADAPSREAPTAQTRPRTSYRRSAQRSLSGTFRSVVRGRLSKRAKTANNLSSNPKFPLVGMPPAPRRRVALRSPRCDAGCVAGNPRTARRATPRARHPNVAPARATCRVRRRRLQTRHVARRARGPRRRVASRIAPEPYKVDQGSSPATPAELTVSPRPSDVWSRHPAPALDTQRPHQSRDHAAA
jgi:hypothetical protein